MRAKRVRIDKKTLLAMLKTTPPGKYYRVVEGIPEDAELLRGSPYEVYGNLDLIFLSDEYPNVVVEDELSIQEIMTETLEFPVE